jgi:hypothetical protein
MRLADKLEDVALNAYVIEPADDLSHVLKRADVLYQKIAQQWLDLIPKIYSQARADKLKENT